MKYVIGVALLFLSACVTAAPPSFDANVNPAFDAASCAASKLSDMGYSVDTRDNGFGLLKATKRDGRVSDYFTTTVNVALVQESGVKTIRVTSDVLRHYNRGRNTQPLGVTNHARADVQTILDACGAN